MSRFAYWINKSGEIMKPDTRHIGAIISKPSLYGETDKTIQATYDKHGEQVSTTVEGKAREEIMLRVIKRGYIRIRKGGTRRNQRWSIQLTRLTPKIQDYLWEWARKMLDSRVETDKFADVTIHQLGKGDKMTRTSMNKIASGEGIKEGMSSKRIYTQDEANAEWPDYFDIAHDYFDEIHEDAQQELIDRDKTRSAVSRRMVSEDDAIYDIASIEVNAMNESSLTRVWSQVKKFDSGTISAFRNARDCGEGLPYTRAEKQKRHTILSSKLLKMGYGITNIKGTFIENFGSKNEIQVKEKAFLVVDISNKGRLRQDLISLGIEFDQDSITYSRPDGLYYLISTNKCPDGYPGGGKIGVSKKLGKPMFGKKGEFYSRVNGRPFVFESSTNRIEDITQEYPTHIRSIVYYDTCKIIDGEVIEP